MNLCTHHRNEVLGHWGLALLAAAICMHVGVTAWLAIHQAPDTVIQTTHVTHCDAAHTHATQPIPDAYPIPPARPVAALWVDRAVVHPGDVIRVSYLVDRRYPDNAWIGVIPTGVPHGSEAENDRHDLSYQYLSGQTEGEMAFEVPDAPGAYDLRLHDTDIDGRELASVSFRVVAEPIGCE